MKTPINLAKSLRTGSFLILATALILSGVIFRMLMDTRDYRASVKILLIPKSDQAANQSEYILANLAVLARTQNVISKAIAADPVIAEELNGLSRAGQIKMWEKMIEWQRLKNSSVIELSVRDRSRTNAIQIAKNATRVIMDTASGYYDIQNDIDLRIIDGPTLVAQPIEAWLRVLLSLLAGFLTAYGIYYLVTLIPSFQLRKVIPQRLSVIPSLDRLKEQLSDLTTERTREVKSYPAPPNLPIADPIEEQLSKVETLSPHEQIVIAEELYNQEQQKEIHPMKPITEQLESSLAEEKKETNDNEEYKKRLNKLLEGNLD